jgi:hypothetical protein
VDLEWHAKLSTRHRGSAVKEEGGRKQES